MNNKTWYIKYKLQGDISIRYHYLWENNKEHEKKWIIKDHQDSIKSIISSDLAKRMIEDLCTEEPVEIMGSTIKGNYTKRIITSDGKCKLIDDKKLDDKHYKRISKKHWSRDGKCLYRLIKNWNYTVSVIGNKFYLVTDDGNQIQDYSGTYEEMKIKASQLSKSTIKDIWFPSEKRITQAGKR